jgi:hypothetical protein
MRLFTYLSHTASKCDDISCGEVIRALNLEDEPELEDVEARISDNTRETRQWKTRKETAEATLKCKTSLLFPVPCLNVVAGVERDKTEAEDLLSDYQAGLEALENGLPFVPRVVGKPKSSESSSRGSKRKKSAKSQESPRKRKKTSDDDDDDDFIVSDDDDAFGDSDPEQGKDANSDEDEDDDNESSDIESGSNADNDENEIQEDISIENVKAKIEEYQQIAKAARESRVRVRKERKEAVDRLATLKKNLARLQREKNAFCSLKRSEVRDNIAVIQLLSVMDLLSSLEMSSKKIFEWV